MLHAVAELQENEVCDGSRSAYIGRFSNSLIGDTGHFILTTHMKILRRLGLRNF